MLKTHVVVVVSMFLCLPVCFAENTDNSQKASKMEELLKNDLAMEISTKFDGNLEKHDYDFLRAYILKCEDIRMLGKIAGIIGKNIHSNENNLKSPDNAEILCMLASKDGMDRWRLYERRFLKIFPRGEFPRNAERVIVEKFQENPSEEYALLIGRYYSSDDIGTKALKSQINNPDEKIAEAARLALARRGDQSIQKAEIERLVNELQREADTDKTDHETFDLIYDRVWKLDYINTAESLYLLCEQLLISNYKSTGGAHPVEAPFVGYVYGIFCDFNINSNGKIISPRDCKVWWKENKDEIREQFEKNVPLYDEYTKARTLKFYEEYVSTRSPKSGLVNLVSFDLRRILEKQNDMLRKVDSSSSWLKASINEVKYYRVEIEGDLHGDELLDLILKDRNAKIETVENRIKKFKESLDECMAVEKQFESITDKLDEEILAKIERLKQKFNENIEKRKSYQEKLSELKEKFKPLKERELKIPPEMLKEF